VELTLPNELDPFFRPSMVIYHGIESEPGLHLLAVSSSPDKIDPEQNDTYEVQAETNRVQPNRDDGD
jgi:hypothetical protein